MAPVRGHVPIPAQCAMSAAPYLTAERRRGASTLIESLTTIILNWCRIRTRDDKASTATFEVTTQTDVGPLRAAELFGGIGPLSRLAPWRQAEREDSNQVETLRKRGESSLLPSISSLEFHVLNEFEPLVQ